MEEKKVPALRFRGFDNAWEQRRFKELFEEKREKTVLEWEDVLLSCAITGIYLNSELFSHFRGTSTIGYLKIKKNDLILSAQNLHLGNANVNLYFESGIISPAYKVFSLVNCDPLFVQAWVKREATNKFFLETTTEGASQCRKNIEWNTLDKQLVSVPTILEGHQIGRYFSQLDHLISLHQRKLEMLKKVKKSMLEKMFPKNDAKVPEVRFSDFTDAWEQCKVNSLFEPLTERNDDLLPYSKTLSVATMTYKEVGNGAADSSLANYKRLRLGDVAFEGHTSKEFRYGRFVLNDAGDGIMSPRFSALRPISELPVQFWKYYIHYEPIMKRSLVNCTKAGTMMNELVVPEFLQESLLVPSTDEQVQIGKYFANLNHLIILHQRKLEKLKNIKKSMLEKMFII